MTADTTEYVINPIKDGLFRVDSLVTKGSTVYKNFVGVFATEDDAKRAVDRVDGAMAERKPRHDR